MIRFVLLLILLTVTSCGSEPTQQERYNDVVSGISYRTYKATAKKTIIPAINLYNSQKPDSVAPLKEGYAHLLLGYGWVISGRSTMAFAEADLAEESSEVEVKTLAVALRSIVMYEMGLDSLGRKESQSLKKYVPVSDSTISYEVTTFYMLMGLAKAYEKSFEESKFYWAGFANETEIHWPYQLVDAFADFQNGKPQAGLQKMKKMSENPAVPSGLRSVLIEYIEKIEEKAGDVNSSLFWPRVISQTLYEQLKASSSTEFSRLMRIFHST